MPEKNKWIDTFFKSLKISKDRAIELGKIATIKSEIYFLEHKMNQNFKYLGETLYSLLKKGKEIDEILKEIQPCINSIDKIEQKINNSKEKIDTLKRELDLSENEYSIIDEVAKSNNEKSKNKEAD